MAIDIRPPVEPGKGEPQKRHPRLVHDEMEAIFGVPASLKPVRRGQAASAPAAALPELELIRPMGSRRLWIGVLIGGLISLIAASLLVRAMLDSHTHPHAQTMSIAQQSPDLPLSTIPLPAIPAPQVAAAAPSPHIAPQPAPMRTVAMSSRAVPQAPVVLSAPAAPDAVPAAAKPKVEETKARCGGTGYEHMSSCPPATVLRADKSLSSAYASAISANVDPDRLAQYSQKWSQLRQTAASNPGATVDEFGNMASQLKALTVSATSQKK